MEIWSKQQKSQVLFSWIKNTEKEFMTYEHILLLITIICFFHKKFNYMVNILKSRTSKYC